VGEERAAKSHVLLERATAFADYSPRLHQYLRRYLRNEADANDLMQEVAVAFLSLPRDRVIRDPLNYLFGMVRIVLNDFLRKKGRAIVSFDSPAADRQLAGMETLTGAAESEAVQSELLRRYRKLPPAYRTVLMLNIETRLSYEAIAQRTGMSVDTVKKYLFKAKASLRRDGLC
jgi:RNA polymerase sigma factor (sigma-70 family)